jgi:hypothetical protein
LSRSVKITGAAELEKALLALPDRIALNIFGGMTLAGAGRIRDAARTFAPLGSPPLPKGNQPGDLRRDIVSGRGRGDRNTVHSIVGLKGRSRQIGHLVEFGHALKGSGRATAKPFMRPALDVAGDGALQVMVRYASDRIDAEVKKLADGA